MEATIVPALPTDPLPTGQGSSLAVDEAGRLHTGDQPFEGGEQITPNDGADVTAPHRAIWVGTAGTIAGEMLGKDGLRKTFATSAPCGVFPYKVLRIKATGTSAQGLMTGW